MTDNKITLNTYTSFAAIPNQIAQQKDLSLASLGMLTFLQSLPPGWKILPKWIQKEKNISADIWQKIARELVKNGYITLIKGGSIFGSHYVFDLWKTPLPIMNVNQKSEPLALVPHRELENPVVEEIPRTGFSQSRVFPESENPVPIKNTPSTQDTGSNNNNTRTREEVVVLEKGIVTDLINFGFSEGKANDLAGLHKESYIREKIALSKKSSLSDPCSWMIAALRKDFKGPTVTQVSSAAHSFAGDVLNQFDEMTKRKSTKVGSVKDFLRACREATSSLQAAC